MPHPPTPQPATASQLAIPPRVGSALRGLRRQIRIYVGLEGVASLVVLLGIAFWAGLLIDWTFEPAPGVRLVAVLLVAAAAAWIASQQLVRRLLRPLPDTSLALLLERHDPTLADHVVTATSLASHPHLRTDASDEFAERTARAAEEVVQHVRPASLLNYRPLRRTVVAAVAVGLSIAVFALLNGPAFGFWLKRIALAPELWPRRVHLEVLGFEPDGKGQRAAKVAHGDDFELTARAQLSGSWEVPDRVEIQYRLPDGRKGRDYLTQIGKAVPGRDEFQTFRYVLKNVRSNLILDVVGGDDRVAGLALKVVDQPRLTWLEIDCAYPDYLQRAPQTLPVSSSIQIPQGTELVIRAGSNKQLVRATARGKQQEFVARISPDPTTARTLTFEYGALAADDVLLVSLSDQDGIRSREPYRLSLSILPDELPQVTANLQGIGTAITPEATIPLIGTIQDDYGLEAAWFEYQVDEQQPQQRAVEGQLSGQTRVAKFPDFDLRARDAGQRLLDVEPGQRLVLSIKATDQCTLTDTPRISTSQRFLLDVVTVSDLLALMERRELSLRQRFQAIHDKLTDTRSLLTRIEFSADQPSSAAESPPVSAAVEADGTAGENGGQEDGQTSLARRRLRIAGALQNVTQSTNEILNVAEGFEHLHAQLVNNRIQNDELRSRLSEQIAAPLWELGESQMPEFESQLRQTADLLSDASQGPVALSISVAAADAVLLEIQRILDRMLELESYNEVVALLRDLVQDQAKLQDKTDRRRTNRLRNLLED